MNRHSTNTLVLRAGGFTSSGEFSSQNGNVEPRCVQTNAEEVPDPNTNSSELSPDSRTDSGITSHKRLLQQLIPRASAKNYCGISAATRDKTKYRNSNSPRGTSPAPPPATSRKCKSCPMEEGHSRQSQPTVKKLGKNVLGRTWLP